jgi:hypothetical protein
MVDKTDRIINCAKSPSWSYRRFADISPHRQFGAINIFPQVNIWRRKLTSIALAIDDSSKKLPVVWP